MFCLRLKLLQITNLPIRIKLRNGNPVKTIHIAIIVERWFRCIYIMLQFFYKKSKNLYTELANHVPNQNHFLKQEYSWCIPLFVHLTRQALLLVFHNYILELSVYILPSIMHSLYSKYSIMPFQPEYMLLVQHFWDGLNHFSNQ